MEKLKKGYVRIKKGKVLKNDIMFCESRYRAGIGGWDYDNPVDEFSKCNNGDLMLGDMVYKYYGVARKIKAAKNGN
jgi:hypothetical protein